MTENQEKHYCYRHPTKETRLTCTECGKYICTKCMIQAPVGQKCPDCVANKTTHLEKITTKQYILAIFVAITISTILGFLWDPFSNGIIGLILAYLYGVIVCKSIQKTIGMKIGFRIQTISAGTTFIGMFYNPLNIILLFLNSNYSLNILLADLQEPVNRIASFFDGSFYSIFFILSLFIGTWASVRHFKL
ncbi:MAG: B-box zinc finger protein [Vampirovibrionia bacterium]